MKLKGYAAHFNVANKNKEIVLPTSFDDSIKAFNRDEITIPVNIDHNEMHIVGKVTNMRTDKVGLFVECELLDGIQGVNTYVKPLIEGEVFKYFSTEGYVHAVMDDSGDGTYIAKVFDIRAVAIVTAPADAMATFAYNSIKPIVDEGDEDYEGAANAQPQRLSIYSLIN